MIQTRQFGPDLKAPVPRPGCTGLSARVIQLPAAAVAHRPAEDVNRHFNGAPIVLDRPNSVIALYLDAHGEMDEHDAPEPILFLVTGGYGFVRVGGPEGDTLAVMAGDAVLWPAHTLHRAWTEAEALEAIAIHYSPDPPPETPGHSLP